MSFYSKWGFIDDPFSTDELEANELGEKLLIGRDKEIKQLHNRLPIESKCITIEGDNGVGKTSLINVSIYKLRKLHEIGRANHLFFSKL